MRLTDLAVLAASSAMVFAVLVYVFMGLPMNVPKTVTDVVGKMRAAEKHPGVQQCTVNDGKGWRYCLVYVRVPLSGRGD